MQAANPAPGLELSRPVRAFEFLPVVGQRAALFGSEIGQFEAWVYPLKILRNFHLRFVVDGEAVPAEKLARTLTVRPESVSILYSGDTYSVTETLFAPVHEPGAMLIFQVEAAQPLEIEAVFERDFQLEWPAGLGGTYINWNSTLNAFYLGEEQKKYAAYVGSPSATEHREEYQTNYSSSRESAFRLGATPKGKATKIIVMAGSLNGPEEAERTYRKLVASYADLLSDSAAYYRDYLARTTGLELPDKQLQAAYDWARVSEIQGLVNNPLLGTGLVAGYRTSGESGRPGFAWFFGRDSLWTDLALTAAGDYANTRTALDFLSKFQRADGKIEHELAQSASLVDWFKNFPYGYASADATPLYIITVNDYVSQSGDVEFAQQKWDSVWRAYQFLKSTYDPQTGFPQNLGVGHGWIEGGPLLPVKSELYQVGLGAEALRALANLAKLTGKADAAQDLTSQFEKQKNALNQVFWSQEKNFYAYALDKDGKRADTASVLTTVPLWFGLLDADKAEANINELAGPSHQADWGMRIISSDDPRYNPGGYHFGSVWPLFTGWASVGEYRYHRALPAYYNLRANALMTFDGSLGHVTEVLSGDYYQQLSTSSPHQIWSAAMVVSPILRGMLGLEVNALKHTVSFAPHVPADWTHFRISGVRVGDAALDLEYRKDRDGIALEVQRKGSAECTLEFSPAIGVRADFLGAELNGRHIAVKVEPGYDQHVTVKAPVPEGSTKLRIRSKDSFDVSYSSTMPVLGSRSRDLRVVSEVWSKDRAELELTMAGIAGKEYELNVWNPGQVISVEGGEMVAGPDGSGVLRFRFPAGAVDSYVRQKVTLRFSAKHSQ
jgi:glycogen debranching enzyme